MRLLGFESSACLLSLTLGIERHDLRYQNFQCLNSLSCKAGIIAALPWGQMYPYASTTLFLLPPGNTGKPHVTSLSVWGLVTSSDYYNVGRSGNDTPGLTPKTSHKILWAPSLLSWFSCQLQKIQEKILRPLNLLLLSQTMVWKYACQSCTWQWGMEEINLLLYEATKMGGCLL